ncbi:DNA-binding transcriptional regulator [Escherichia coli]|uniref:DNA-binding transcriptional regulator n=1 Tax=Escherichia coli TaxID=562 RepID=A0A447XRS2_ECOLX|nr:DNA-binding transcriptional regulator [Escherichia coli]
MVDAANRSHFLSGLKKLMDQVRKKVTIRCINRQRFAEEMQILREIFNSGWQHNWGFVPFTEHEFASMGDQLKYLVPDDMIYIAEIDSAPCAFIVGLPNINEAIADLNGSLFPFGWAKLLWRLKVSGVRTARVPLMGVRDEYQFSRIGPVIALLLIEALRDPFARRKIDALEMSWILETNTGMNNMLERIGAEPYKRYRLYEKADLMAVTPASSPAAPPSESNGGLPARYRGDSFSRSAHDRVLRAGRRAAAAATPRCRSAHAGDRSAFFAVVDGRDYLRWQTLN